MKGIPSLQNLSHPQKQATLSHVCPTASVFPREVGGSPVFHLWDCSCLGSSGREREWGWGKGLSRIVSWLPKCSFIFFLKFWDIESNYSPLRVQIKATATYGQVSMCQEVCLITFFPCLFFKTHNNPMEPLLLLFSLFPCWGNWELLKSNNNLELVIQGICKIQRLKSNQF